MIAYRSETLIAEAFILLICILLMGIAREWIHSIRTVLPLICLVFIIAFFSFGTWTAFLLSLRLYILKFYGPSDTAFRTSVLVVRWTCHRRGNKRVRQEGTYISKNISPHYSGLDVDSVFLYFTYNILLMGEIIDRYYIIIRTFHAIILKIVVDLSSLIWY